MIDYTFKNKDLLSEALTHPSLCNDQNNKGLNYERLEFLGDRVLGLAISEILFKKHPDLNEGQLAVIHANLVNSKCIADVAKKINLGDMIIMDHGEESIGGRSNPKNLENAMEAMIGAIYLDSNYETTSNIIYSLWEDYIKVSASMNKRDNKSELQEWCQQRHLPLPVYSVSDQSGPSHSPLFKMLVEINDMYQGEGIGKSKKTAELDAAGNLLNKLKNI